MLLRFFRLFDRAIKQVLLILLLGLPMVAPAQTMQTLSLKQAFELAEKNYPDYKQKDLLQQTKNLNIQNLQTAYLPQVVVNGQASYQSDVTKVEVPLPGINIPSQSNDQYKLYADVSQLIYDGGMVKEQKKVQELTAAIGNNKVNIELYNLRSRVFQLYFAILLQQELQTQTRLLIHDVQSGIDKVKAQVENGVVLRSNLWLLQAQQLQTSQRMIELQSTRSGLLAALGKLLNVSFDTTLLLKKDDVSFTSDTAIQRPEITLYKSQIALLQSQKQLLSAKNKPRLSAFVQGGYGKPGLNLLSDKFDPYYIGGMRAEWSLGNLYTARRDRKLLGISQQTIDLQRETFLLNTRSQLSQQQAEIDKYQQLIATDKAIIDIRKNISDAAKAQLENAVITSNDYLREINAEDQARQTMIVHEIQSLQAKANYAIISGTL